MRTLIALDTGVIALGLFAGCDAQAPLEPAAPPQPALEERL